MRYKDTGNVHKDFHRATDRTVRYVAKRYGMDFLKELFRRTAQQVYADIYGDLKAGNAEPLVEHWSYYYEREGGVFDVRRDDSRVSFAVTECPMVRHLQENGHTVDSSTYLPAILMNEAWSEDTPFSIDTEIHGDGGGHIPRIST